MRDQNSRNRETSMHDGGVSEAMSLVRQCACPAEGLSIKAQIRQAARTVGLPFNRTKKLWYGEARVRVDEIDTLRWRAREARERAELRMGVVDEIRQKVNRAFPDPGERDRGPFEPVARDSGREDR